jgi:hypothetical protein
MQPDALDRSKALFIRRWGEMGGYWGINRTMAELHATINRCREMAAEQNSELREDRAREARVYRQRLDAMAEFLNGVMLLLNMILRSGEGGLSMLQKSMAKTAK